MAIKGRSFLKAALLFAASAGLSGCVYDVGLGFASDGYYDDAYACDPFGGYDAYYNCDYGHAFSNIGFGGGWYDNYYYPGHGIFLFDTFGRRYPMREQYRRYWGERRHNWYREHHGRSRERSRYEGLRRVYEDTARPERSPSGRMRHRDDDSLDGWRDGKRDGNNQWRGGDGRGVGAVTTPRTGASQGQGRGQDYRGGYRQHGHRGRRVLDANTASAAALDNSRRQQNVVSAEQPPETGPEPQGPQIPCQRMPEGCEERPN